MPRGVLRANYTKMTAQETSTTLYQNISQSTQYHTRKYLWSVHSEALGLDER
jgi:hypothetical protein